MIVDLNPDSNKIHVDMYAHVCAYLLMTI